MNAQDHALALRDAVKNLDSCARAAHADGLVVQLHLDVKMQETTPDSTTPQPLLSQTLEYPLVYGRASTAADPVVEAYDGVDRGLVSP